jgi:hypothetical protein
MGIWAGTGTDDCHLPDVESRWDWGVVAVTTVVWLPTDRTTFWAVVVGIHDVLLGLRYAKRPPAEAEGLSVDGGLAGAGDDGDDEADAHDGETDADEQ